LIYVKPIPSQFFILIFYVINNWSIAIGKGIGFIFGLTGFICLPYFLPEVSSLTRWGILLWYPTVGAIIGVFGVFTYHPILQLPMPWWCRAPLIGAWMNLVLTFFAYDVMSAMTMAVFGNNGLMTSPFWFVAEGAVIALVIGYVATRLAVKAKRLLTNIEDGIGC
jgi:hypothetical protein